MKLVSIRCFLKVVMNWLVAEIMLSYDILHVRYVALKFIKTFF